MRSSRVSFVCMLVLLWGCGQRSTSTSAASPAETPAATSTATTASSSVAESSSPQPAPSLDAARGKELGLVFEAYLSPHQESNEEANTPSSVPQQFRSTTASMTRDQREAAGHRGHGQLRFSKDLSRA